MLLMRVLILAVAVLLTTAASSHPPYNRAERSHWIDADGDCQNTWVEVLLRDAQPGTVTFRDARECVMESGKWVEPYTGNLRTGRGTFPLTGSAGGAM